MHLCTLDQICYNDIYKFIEIISNIDTFFQNRIQQDAHECFLKLLDIFDTGINAVHPGVIKFQDSYFQGKFKVVKRCKNCNNKLLYLAPFYDIKVKPTIDINDTIKKAFQDSNNIYMLL